MTLRGFIHTVDSQINGFTNPPTPIPGGSTSYPERSTDMKRHQIIAICGLLLLAHRVHGACSASISGKVLDEQGLPVPQALVSLAEIRAHASHKATRFFISDTEGVFHADVDFIDSAQFSVLAKKEEIGYPNTIFAIYNEREPAKVSLTCGSSASGVVVNIGPKTAFILQISVVDEKSGEAIPDASITLQRLISPIPRFPVERFSITTSTTIMKPDSNHLGLAVPSNVDVSYVISAHGFEPSRPVVIHLPPLKTIKLSTRLERAQKAPGMPGK